MKLVRRVAGKSNEIMERARAPAAAYRGRGLAAFGTLEALAPTYFSALPHGVEDDDLTFDKRFPVR